MTKTSGTDSQINLSIYVNIRSCLRYKFRNLCFIAWTQLSHDDDQHDLWSVVLPPKVVSLCYLHEFNLIILWMQTGLVLLRSTFASVIPVAEDTGRTVVLISRLPCGYYYEYCSH
jgi:hypothetical protein